MASPRMDERWMRIRDRIKNYYSEADLSDSDLRKTRGDLGKMVHLLHQETGQPPQEIRRTVTALM